MAKQTKTVKGSGKTAITSGRTTNLAGGTAFQLKDRERLVTGILTSFVSEPKYYGDTTPEVVEAARNLIKTDPVFVAKAACFARNQFHMRSISHVLAAEVAKGASGNPIVRRMVRKVVERADDITNILAYHFKTWGKRKKNAAVKVTRSDNPVPRGLRRGIADVFPRFDEYALAKYKGADDDVKLRDALLISRPKPESKAQAALWKKLIEGKLETPETRETILSEQGQSKEVWEKILDGGKAGYMMVLRNLKNMLEQKISDKHLDKVCEMLRDPDQVRKSKQLPFRFFSAHKMVAALGNVKGTKVLDAIEDALMVSFENLPRLKGTTAIILDESGSMQTPISEKSMVQQIDIGNLLGSAAAKFCDQAIIIPFGDHALTMNFTKRSSIFDNMQKLEDSGVGCSTYLEKAFKEIDKAGVPVDRIIIFSDMQTYGEDRGYFRGNDNPQGWVANYKKTKNPNLWVHSIDLAGYGTTKVVGDKINLIAGWSEKVLDYIGQVEEGGQTLVKSIEEYQI
jgi:60 kDa SS-A/Ro ribonucleoprotein